MLNGIKTISLNVGIILNKLLIQKFHNYGCPLNVVTSSLQELVRIFCFDLDNG